MSERSVSLPTGPIRAWAKSLTTGGVQYYARVGQHERIMGRANHAEEAHDLICDYVYGLVPNEHPDDWEIEWKDAAGVWDIR